MERMAGYRRGPATNLKRLSGPDIVIQAILRHTDVSTTQRFSIKTVGEDVGMPCSSLSKNQACSSCAGAGADSSGKLKKINTRPT
jgi:hypothetical protein